MYILKFKDIVGIVWLRIMVISQVWSLSIVISRKGLRSTIGTY